MVPLVPGIDRVSSSAADSEFGSKSCGLVPQFLLREHRGSDDVIPRDRSGGGGVVHKPRHDVGMQMGHGVAEGESS